MSALRKAEPKYTYKDYLQFDDGLRCELINGYIYAMASPAPAHQRVSGKIFRRISNFLEDNKKRCEAFYELDTRLNYAKNDDTVLRPDVVVVCDTSKIGEKSINGAPDMVVEVLSTSTAKIDQTIKLSKYREAGVKVIWFVDPVTEVVQVLTGRDDGTYDAIFYANSDDVPVIIFPEFFINCNDIFPQPIEEDNTNEDN